MTSAKNPTYDEVYGFFVYFQFFSLGIMIKKMTKKILSTFMQAIVLVLLLALSTSHAAEPTAKVIPQTQILNINGTSVEVDVYKPIGPQKGAAILTHGFTRSRTTM